MANQRPLILTGGTTQRQLDADSLIVGAGILTNSGNLTITAASGIVSVNGGQVSNVLIDNQSSDPGSPAESRLWYNTTSHVLKYYNGTSVISLTSASGTAGGDLSGTYPNPTVTGLRGWIDGFITANNGSNSKSLSIAAGQARDSTNALNITTSATYYKSLAGTWSSGAGSSGSPVNGLDTGTVSSGTWYYMWAISNGSGGDFLFSKSATSPTMPGGYSYKRLIGAMLTDGSSNWLAYVQKHDFFELGAVQTELASSSQTANTTSTLALLFVPSGYAVEVRLSAGIKNASEVGDHLYVGDADCTNQTGKGSNPIRAWATNGDTSNFFGAIGDTWTGTGTNAGKIFYGQDAAAGTPIINIATIGWRDPRGRNS